MRRPVASIVAVLLLVVLAATLPVEVSSKRLLTNGPLQQAGGLLRSQAQQLLLSVKNYLGTNIGTPMKVFFCPMFGADLKGTAWGDKRGVGFIFLMLYKRTDGDYNLRYIGFSKLGTTEKPSPSINLGPKGEDGDTVLDLSTGTFVNVTRTASLGYLSWYSGDTYALGYNWLFTGKMTRLSEQDAGDGYSTLKDSMDVMMTDAKGYYGNLQTSDYNSALRGQCGIDTSGLFPGL
eukprot:TRINITY_DN3325_c0_g1_i1.p1 TRINITY_DN3325_c0_g1~~TRINITY_DN3325_c0_g1_i1.p1  ORF type:complete len:234 (-),score=2.57 TRINITY_DN3325_c0_g1_i1:249-950(-)